jgi:hypothetical protein
MSVFFEVVLVFSKILNFDFELVLKVIPQPFVGLEVLRLDLFQL